MFTHIFKLRLPNQLLRFNFNSLLNQTRINTSTISYSIIIHPVSTRKFSKSMALKSGSVPKYVNRLTKEKSPYLLQHANNPVDWYPWGEEAISKARTENKLIFLSIGYSTCHWCHIMEQESFEDEKIAKIMNENFVNIKVDREERPDIDKLYMTFILLINGSGGWPMSIWLTPELAPITGGTYFPPNDKWGMAGFSTVLLKIASKWNNDEDRANLLQTGASVIEAISKSVSQNRAECYETNENSSVEDKFKQSIRIYKQNFDKELGGSKGAPKFPEVSKLNFLLHAFIQTKDEEIMYLALNTLKKMSNGGIHDQIFGGFARYSVDKNWKIPHFEKMLYDQGQLLIVFANAYKITQDEYYLNVADKIFKYICKDLYHRDGGFYSAEDADSLDPNTGSANKVEGAFYAFTYQEILETFKKNAINFECTEAFEVYIYHYDVKPEGNVDLLNDPHGHLSAKNILYINGSVEKTAAKFLKTSRDVENILTIGNGLLHEYREQRPRPHLDSKIICAWNGLALSGISKLSTINHASNNIEYLRIAKKLVVFIRENMFDAVVGKLLRARYVDETKKLVAISITPAYGFLDDYAFIIKGLIDHYTATMDTSSLLFAKELQEMQDKLFWDDLNGAYFYSEANASNVVVRMKEDHDGAEPCGNSISAYNLIMLGAYFENQNFKDRAQKLSNYFSNTPAFGYVLPEMLSALVMENDGLKMLVIVGNVSKDMDALCSVAQSYFIPGLVTICSKLNDEDQLTRKSAAQFKMIKDKATAYICHNKRCNLPIIDPEVLREEFDSNYLFKNIQ